MRTGTKRPFDLKTLIFHNFFRPVDNFVDKPRKILLFARMISIEPDKKPKIEVTKMPHTPLLKIVAGTDVDIPEKSDSMLKGRFASEREFGKFLIQDKLLRENLAAKLAKVVDVPPPQHQLPRDLTTWTPMGQQQQSGSALKPKSP